MKHGSLGTVSVEGVTGNQNEELVVQRLCPLTMLKTIDVMVIKYII